MQLLRDKLNDAADSGKRFVRIELHSSHPSVEEVCEYAESIHWHVRAVWRGEASITYVLFRYDAP